MPTRPAIHQPHFAKTAEQRERAERERQRRKDAERPSASERGYDRDWRALRARFVVDHPLCSVPGCGKPTVDVDHIEDLRTAPERRLDPSNLRPYCHAHHAQRTARDQGFARPKVEREADRVSTYGALYPDWLRPSRVPLRLVCGPPGAGQDAYVAARLAVNELIIDLEEIRAARAGETVFQAGRAGLGDAIRERNRLLGSLSSPVKRYAGAWFIVPAPKLETRMWWRAKLKPVAVVILATDERLCRARIDDDPRRERVRDEHYRAVARWWREFEKGAGERVMH